ncbi:uncharacterized protein LOC126910254 [Daktulosphaira vitifoliae]|uniref:uncharacterized protein LOC126910254 n=1 Tax=Daktulosphaira vitifoliae TaxID=58002 RepID=UPI0021AABA4A|nr:uncharacterized protein LOC126910254 [Daktulosphaira vitifoliae]
MSEFEFTESSGNENSSDDDDFPIIAVKRKIDNTVKVVKELRLFYSNLFIDCFNLIDNFVKGQNLTFMAFLEVFESFNFHYIYAKPKKEIKNLYVSPHHYIMMAQDAMSAAAKFLRSKSKKARIGAFYLLYTLYKTQPLKPYLLNIKMDPYDFNETKKLVNEYMDLGELHPAYCFYELELKRKITITADTTSPCLEANYPRKIVRKLMGRIANNYLKIHYEDRVPLNNINKLQLMECQMKDESLYVKKLENMTLGTKRIYEYQPELTSTLEAINDTKKSTPALKEDDIDLHSKMRRYKNKKNVAFPGKNEDVLEDMVIVTEPKPLLQANCNTKKKSKLLKKRGKITNQDKSRNNLLKPKIEPNSLLINANNFSSDSEVSQSSINSEDPMHDSDLYGDIIRRVLEESDEDTDQKNIVNVS